MQKARQARRIAAGQDPLSVDPNCYATAAALQGYLNQADVKAALHVAPGVTFALCSNNFTFQYSSDMKDERAVVYPALTKQAGYRVVVYNGACAERHVLVAAPCPSALRARCALVYARRRALSPQARRTFACRSRTMSGGRAP